MRDPTVACSSISTPFGEDLNDEIQYSIIVQSEIFFKRNKNINNYMTLIFHNIKNFLFYNSIITLFLIISLHHVLHLKTLDFGVFNPSFINLEVPV